MVYVEEVPYWKVLRGIGHAVTSLEGDWLFVACGSMISGNMANLTKETPRRICRKCRAALTDMTLTPDNKEQFDD